MIMALITPNDHKFSFIKFMEESIIHKIIHGHVFCVFGRQDLRGFRRQ